MSDKRHSVYTIAINASILLVLLSCLYISFNKRIVSDELESLAAASFIVDGKVPYRDFWQIHTPLFYYLLTPLTAFFKIMSVFYAGRFLSFLILILNGYFLYLIASRLFSRRAAIFSVLGYFSCVPVLKTMLEIRPDILVITFANLSLLLLLGKRFSPAVSFCWAGVMAGLAFLAKQSGLFFILGAACFFLIRLLFNQDRFWGQDHFSRERFNLRNVILFFGGFLVTVIVFYFSLLAQGALEPFLEHAVRNDFLNAFMRRDIESIHWAPGRSLQEMFFASPLLFLSAGVFPVYLVFNRNRVAIATVNGFIFIFCLTAVSFYVLFFILHPWRQEFLFFCQYLALLAGPVLALTYDRLAGLWAGRKGQVSSVIMCFILLSLICFPSVQRIFKTEEFDLKHELAEYALILSLTNKDDKCLSVASFPFRPSVYYYRIGSIHVESPSLIAKIDDSLMREVLHGRIMVIVPHIRYERFPRLYKFIQSHYVLHEYPFYIPGQLWKKGEVKDFVFTAPVEGYYQIKGESKGIFIDGAAFAGDPVFLKKGEHRVNLPDTSQDRWIVYDFPANKKRSP